MITSGVKRQETVWFVACAVGACCFFGLTGCEESLPLPNEPPRTPLIIYGPAIVEAGDTVYLAASATDPDDDPIVYEWSANGGSFDKRTGSNVAWFAPIINSIEEYEITVTVRDDRGASASGSAGVTVVPEGVALAWEEDFESYPPLSFPPTWTPGGNAAVRTTNYVDSTMSFEGGKSLRLFGIVTECWPALTTREHTISYPYLNLGDPFEIMVAIRCGHEFVSGCDPPIRAAVSLTWSTAIQSPRRELVKFMGDGRIVGGQGDNAVSLGTYTTREWYRVKIRYEIVSHTQVLAGYWINGVYMGSGSFFPLDEEFGLVNIELMVWEGTAWFDAVRIFH